MELPETDDRYPLYKRLKSWNDMDKSKKIEDIDNQCSDILEEINRNKDYCAKRVQFMSYNKIRVTNNQCM